MTSYEKYLMSLDEKKYLIACECREWREGRKEKRMKIKQVGTSEVGNGSLIIALD